MHTLVSKVVVNAPIERCFDITRSIEAHEDTSILIGGRAVSGTTTGLSELGDETTWSAGFFGLRFKVRTRIEELEAPIRICEKRVSGIPRPFDHTYVLGLVDGGVLIEDHFNIGFPFGALGDFFLKVVLLKRLTVVQNHRLESIRKICEGDNWRSYLRHEISQ